MTSYQVFRFESSRLDELEKFRAQFGNVYEPRARVNPALAMYDWAVAKEKDRICRELDFLVFNSKTPYCLEHPRWVVGEIKTTTPKRVEGGNKREYELLFCLTVVKEEYERQISNYQELLSDFGDKPLLVEAYKKKLKMYRNRLDALKKGVLCDGIR
jgi:hypothetical protein